MLPTVSTTTMTVFLRHFSATLADDEHAVMVVDGAGWHISHALLPPNNVTLLRLPPYAPELNPVERVWPICASDTSRTACTTPTPPLSTRSARLGAS